MLRDLFKWPIILFPACIALAFGTLLYLRPYSVFHSENEGYLPLIFLGLAALIGWISNLYSMRMALEVKPILRAIVWSLIVFLLMFFPVKYALNIIFDFSQAKEIVVAIDDKYSTTGKYPTNNIIIKDAFLGKGSWNVSVKSTFFDSVKIGDRVILEVHPGVFSTPWFTGKWSVAY